MFSQSADRGPVNKLSAGMFIVIEGLDGSGGTTQVERLAAAFRAREPTREVVLTREPSDGLVGRWIRAELAGGSVSDSVLPYLFAADRRDHLDRVVLPALERGAVVISDRYALSSLAYQAAAVGLDRVRALNEGFPAPRFTFLLDLDPEACLARIEARGRARDRFETLHRLRIVADGYEAALVAQPDPGVVRVDAGATADEVHARILAAIWPT